MRLCKIVISTLLVFAMLLIIVIITLSLCLILSTLTNYVGKPRFRMKSQARVSCKILKMVQFDDN